MARGWGVSCSPDRLPFEITAPGDRLRARATRHFIAVFLRRAGRLAWPLFRFSAAIALPGARLLYAQRPEEEAAVAAAAATGCAACGGFVIFMVAIFALNIALLVWVARDAKARGMDNSVLWMLLVMATSILGLVIYLSSRPKGDLSLCATCGNKRLQASAKCPHCGNL